MKPTAPWLVLGSLVTAAVLVGCTTFAGSPSPAPISSATQAASPPGEPTHSAEPTPAEPTHSAEPTSSATEKPAFEVGQQGSDGPEISILIYDPMAQLTAARGATEQDQSPEIAGEAQPRIGPVPGSLNQLRVLWGGYVCDTTYEVWIGTNENDGAYIDVTQGPLSNPDCDTIGIRRGVVLTFAAQVDATKATGTVHSSVPQ